MRFFTALLLLHVLQVLQSLANAQLVLLLLLLSLLLLLQLQLALLLDSKGVPLLVHDPRADCQQGALLGLQLRRLRLQLLLLLQKCTTDAVLGRLSGTGVKGNRGESWGIAPAAAQHPATRQSLTCLSFSCRTSRGVGTGAALRWPASPAPSAATSPSLSRP